MSDIKKLNKITSILIEHSNDDDDLECAAEHDEMYLGGPNTERLDQQVISDLEALGCIWDDEYDCWHVFT